MINIEIRNFARKRFLPSIVIVTILFGWKYYWISYSVPIVMGANILTLFLKRGRFVCGNLCPRGAFFDALLKPFAGKRKIPRLLKKKSFRFTILVLLFGFFIFQAMRSPYSFEKFGHLFWIMCTATTILAIILGIFFNHRAWCGFCPIGTILRFCGSDNYPIKIDNGNCVSCQLCEKICPMGISIIKDRSKGYITDKDCIKCQECVFVCPRKAVSK